MKKLLLFLFVFLSNDVFSIEKIKQFEVNILTLDSLTNEYANKREIFNSDYSGFLLYRAIILNDFIKTNFVSKNTIEFFCNQDNENLIKLLKWKIVNIKNKKDLIERGVKCLDIIESSKMLMDTYFFDSDYVEAYLEYYKLIKLDKSYDLLEKWSYLSSNLYKTPDFEIAENLIDIQHEIFLKYGKWEGEWNISVIASKYGSIKGLKNIELLKEG